MSGPDLSALPPVTIATVYGDGWLGKGVTGVLRIGALNCQFVVGLTIGELATRAIANTLGSIRIGYKPGKDSNITRIISWVNDTSVKLNLSRFVPTLNVRPFKLVPAEVDTTDPAKHVIRKEAKNTAVQLVIQAVILTALGILANEGVRIIGGKTPSIYNNVLTVVGNIRIDDKPYLQNLRVLLTGTWVGSKIGF